LFKGDLKMVLGEKLWEGKGKSAGQSFIKDVDMSGVTTMYNWSAQVKGMGKAKGVDGNLNVTSFGMQPPKGISKSKDQGMFMTATGDMGILKGMALMKMPPGSKPTSVGLWTFMTMSEKLSWMNDLIAVVTFEALDPMWMEFNITISEWK
jgi:hypothetical protein